MRNIFWIFLTLSNLFALQLFALEIEEISNARQMADRFDEIAQTPMINAFETARNLHELCYPHGGRRNKILRDAFFEKLDELRGNPFSGSDEISANFDRVFAHARRNMADILVNSRHYNIEETLEKYHPKSIPLIYIALGNSYCNAEEDGQARKISKRIFDPKKGLAYYLKAYDMGSEYAGLLAASCYLTKGERILYSPESFDYDMAKNNAQAQAKAVELLNKLKHSKNAFCAASAREMLAAVYLAGEEDNLNFDEAWALLVKNLYVLEFSTKTASMLYQFKHLSLIWEVAEKTSIAQENFPLSFIKNESAFVENFINENLDAREINRMGLYRASCQFNYMGISKFSGYAIFDTENVNQNAPYEKYYELLNQKRELDAIQYFQENKFLFEAHKNLMFARFNFMKGNIDKYLTHLHLALQYGENFLDIPEEDEMKDHLAMLILNGRPQKTYCVKIAGNIKNFENFILRYYTTKEALNKIDKSDTIKKILKNKRSNAYTSSEIEAINKEKRRKSDAIWRKKRDFQKSKKREIIEKLAIMANPDKECQNYPKLFEKNARLSEMYDYILDGKDYLNMLSCKLGAILRKDASAAEIAEAHELYNFIKDYGSKYDQARALDAIWHSGFASLKNDGELKNLARKIASVCAKDKNIILARATDIIFKAHDGKDAEANNLFEALKADLSDSQKYNLRYYVCNAARKLTESPIKNGANKDDKLPLDKKWILKLEEFCAQLGCNTHMARIMDIYAGRCEFYWGIVNPSAEKLKECAEIIEEKSKSIAMLLTLYVCYLDGAKLVEPNAQKASQLKEKCEEFFNAKNKDEEDEEEDKSIYFGLPVTYPANYPILRNWKDLISVAPNFLTRFSFDEAAEKIRKEGGLFLIDGNNPSSMEELKSLISTSKP